MSQAFIAAGLAIVAFASPLAAAHGYIKGTIEVRHPWTRATPPGAEVAAGYLEIRNTGREPDRVIGASSPAAERVEMHVTASEKGVMKMREVTSFEAPARKRLVMRPDGTHLMIVGLRKPFVKGQRIPLTLRFERAGEVRVEMEVQPGGSKKPHH